MFKIKINFSLSTFILIGFVLGILCGLFFGEYCSFLEVIGGAFIGLLQMTVLPFVILSLIKGLGQLAYHEASSLAKKCGLLLLLLWSITFAVILIMPLAYPNWESASFFSTSAIQKRVPFNFIDLYIPTNPFYSMANNIVPAVVLFSIGIGVALIGVKNKQSLLDSITVLTDALTKVAFWVVNLTPIGIFAITAHASGTMNGDEFGRLQVYFVSYFGIWALLSFWILPGLVTSFTRLRYFDIIKLSKDALITAFATQNLFIVLPLLLKSCKDILVKNDLDSKDSDAIVDVVVPTCFTFPNAGVLLTLSFVLFAGWFTDSQISLLQYPTFIISGLLSFFGSVIVAIPFLLDLFRIPADTFQLFIASDFLIAPFGTLLAAMHILVLTLLAVVALNGKLTIIWSRLIRYTILSIVFVAVTLGATHFFLTHFITHEYSKDKLLVEMHLLENAMPIKVHKPPHPLPVVHAPQKSGLDLIIERGSLRVGYLKDQLRFVFVYSAGDLVGFDVAIAQELARELGVTLEFVLLEHKKMAEQLTAGHCDILMAGIAITTDNSRDMTFTTPYMDATLALIVKDYRRDEFVNRSALNKLSPLKVGALDIPYFTSLIKKSLPHAEIVFFDSPREFFKGKGDKLDAFLFTAEGGSAWTLLYPDYTVVIPAPDYTKVPLAYAVAKGDTEFINFLNSWIILKQKDATFEKAYKYWILGHGSVSLRPRWSIIRDVLHWVD